MKKPFLLLFTFFSTLIASTAHASIEADLKDFFESAGMHSNLNSPGVYQDQAAGYYTGGSFVARNAVKSAQLATVQMPGYRAGCGGIDAWAGGFSHISGQELVNMLRSVGSSAASYAFLLSLQTVSPQIYNIMNELNALATKANHLNINPVNICVKRWVLIWVLFRIGRLLVRVVALKEIEKKFLERKVMMKDIKICWWVNLTSPGKRYK